MHGMHARMPKNFVLEERLERYADAIELAPARFAGCWAEACAPLTSTGVHPFREVRLDLGCGKGAFLVASAQQEPDVLFVGIDAEPICVAYTAQHIQEAHLRNAVVVAGKGSCVTGTFGPHELSVIHLNFPTPYPRKREAHKRLVALERLLEYRDVLSETGCLRLRTDSLPLRTFALEQLGRAGYEILWSSDDERLERPDEPVSEYEERLTAQGAPVLGLAARPARLPEHITMSGPSSLVDYLPEDLFRGSYIPHGMGGTVTNLRNRAIRNRKQSPDVS